MCAWAPTPSRRNFALSNLSSSLPPSPARPPRAALLRTTSLRGQAHSRAHSTCMNSLNYLSRQFDVLASPRTPPSTPTLENAPLLRGHDDDEYAGSLKRVKTWSQKSFVVVEPGSSAYSAWSLKRSYSSPAEVGPGEPSSSLAPSTPARTPPAPSSSRPPSRRPSVTSSEKGLCPPSGVESIWSRMLFVRVLLSLWHYMCAVWCRMTANMAQQSAHQIAPEDVSDEDDKDTEDEGKEEKPALIQVQPPPVPPPLPLPVTTLSHIAQISPGSNIYYLDLKTPVSPDATPVFLTSTPALGAGDLPRTSTPVPATRKTPLHLPKTLVLDLDETLIHSTSRPMYHASSGSGILNRLGFGRRDKGTGHTVEVVLGGRSTLYHVYKRPFVDYFLRKVRVVLPQRRGAADDLHRKHMKVSTWYTLVIFTASMQEYADPVIDWLDAGRGILSRRLFREVRTYRFFHPTLCRGAYRLTRRLNSPAVMHTTTERVIYQRPIDNRAGSCQSLPCRQFTHMLYHQRRYVRRFPCSAAASPSHFF